MTVWRDVTGYGGVYQVSEFGGVRKTHGHKRGVMKPFVKRPIRGSIYRCVRLTGEDGRRHEAKVAKLVAEAFLGPIRGRAVVHRNGNLCDDSADNLAYVSRQRLGIDYGARAKSHGVVKVSPSAEIVDVYRSAREAARKNHMSYQTVIDRCNGKVKSFLAPDGFRYVWDRSSEADALYGVWEMDGYVESDGAERILARYPRFGE